MVKSFPKLFLMDVEKMDSGIAEKQVVSKKRVADHGEVYNGKREVNAMLNLVKQETEKIESRIKRDIKGINLGLGQRDHDVTTIVRTFTRTRLIYLPSSLFRSLSSLSQTALASSIFFSSILSSP